MKIRRTISPSAAPLRSSDLIHGISGIIGTVDIKEVEDGFKKHFGVKHVFMVSSGKAALYVILSALKNIRKKKYVVMPAYTCYSVPSAVLKAGLGIRLCDINPETLDYNHEMLEKVVDDEVLCILSTHLFGIPSDVSRLTERYGEKGIFIVEDAAQSMGGEIQGRKLGTIGDAGFFSLGRGKNITTGGGGIILTSSDAIADSVREIYRSLGKEPLFDYFISILQVIFLNIFINPLLYWFPAQLSFLKIGETKFYNDFPVYRLNGFKIGLLSNWESKLEMFNRRRSEISDYYIGLIQQGRKLHIHSSAHPLLRFPFYISDPGGKILVCRDYFYLGISPMYPDSIENIEEIRDRFRGCDYPGAKYVVDRLITLPTHVLLNEKDKSDLAEMLKGLRK